jgi:hypothetical protein
MSVARTPDDGVPFVPSSMLPSPKEPFSQHNRNKHCHVFEQEIIT